MLNAIAWRFRTGMPWRDLPERFGPWQTVYDRFNRWAKDGTFARLLLTLMGEAHVDGELDWLVAVDSTIVRAHQHAAGGRAPVLRGGWVELQEVRGLAPVGT